MITTKRVIIMNRIEVTEVEEVTDDNSEAHRLGSAEKGNKLIPYLKLYEVLLLFTEKIRQDLTPEYSTPRAS